MYGTWFLILVLVVVELVVQIPLPEKVVVSTHRHRVQLQTDCCCDADGDGDLMVFDKLLHGYDGPVDKVHYYSFHRVFFMREEKPNPVYGTWFL